MGFLVGYGALVVIGVVMAIITSIVGLFFGNIILFDSIALAIVAGSLSYGLLHVHPAFALIIGLVVLVALYMLQHTDHGFWIIGGLLSLFWGGVFGVLAMFFSNGDNIWTLVVFGLGTLLMISLHHNARDESAL